MKQGEIMNMSISDLAEKIKESATGGIITVGIFPTGKEDEYAHLSIVVGNSGMMIDVLSNAIQRDADLKYVIEEALKNASSTVKKYISLN